MGFLEDFFGDEEDKTSKYAKSREFEVPKEELCEKLGFKTNQVNFISYDYKKGVLTIKVKE